MTDIDLWLVEPAKHVDHPTGPGRVGRTARSTAAVLRDDPLTAKQRAALLDERNRTDHPLKPPGRR